MKQVITAAVLLLAALIAGIMACRGTVSLSREITSCLEIARSEVRAGNWDTAGERITSASSHWKSSRRMLGLIAGDTELCAVDVAIAKVESQFEQRDAGELDLSIRLVALLIEGISEREAFNWHNVG